MLLFWKSNKVQLGAQNCFVIDANTSSHEIVMETIVCKHCDTCISSVPDLMSHLDSNLKGHKRM